MPEFDKQKRLFLNRILAISCMSGVLILSFLPLRVKYLLHTKGWLHPWGHLLAFFLCSNLLLGSVRKDAHRVAILLFTLAFGCAIEMSQLLIFGTPLEWRDVRWDTFGSILAALVTWCWRLRFSESDRSTRLRSVRGKPLDLS